MSTVSSAVIARQDAQADGKPSVTYRYAGDGVDTGRGRGVRGAPGVGFSGPGLGSAPGH